MDTGYVSHTLIAQESTTGDGLIIGFEDTSDTLHGGTGNDWLYGGAGADIFQYDTATASTQAQQDRITDFETGVDILSIDIANMADVAIQAVNGFYEVSSANTGLSVQVDNKIVMSDIVIAGAA